MSRWKGNNDQCPVCGLVYRKLSTGMSYTEVRMLLWVGDPNYDNWKYKRRNTVLGLWHQIKMSMWHHHLIECEQMLMYYEAKELKEKESQELKEILAAYGNYQGDEDTPF